jgi:excisionase family DNA binding protein
VSDRRLLTARELADELGVSTGALLRWTRAGKVPAVKLPSGAVRYVPDQIDDWLTHRSLQGNTEGTGVLSLFPACSPHKETER